MEKLIPEETQNLAHFINDQVNAGIITPQEASTIDMDKYKEVQESWIPTDLRMNGKDVRVFGVLHTPATLEFHEQDLEESIKQSSIVVLEIAPEAIGIFNQETLNFLQDNVLLEGQIISAAKWQENLVSNESINFYHKLELLAAKNNKPVAQIHAFSDSEQKLLSAAAIEARSKDIPNLKIITAILSLILGDKIKYKGQEAPDTNPLSEIDWTYEDAYREAATIEGLNKLTAMERIQSPVTMVFGSDHIKPIVEYSGDSKKRLVKFPDLTNPKIQIFQPDATGQWIEV